MLQTEITKIERKIIQAIITHCQMSGEFVQSRFAGFGDAAQATSLAEMKKQHISISEDLHSDWIAKNSGRASLADDSLPVKLIEEDEAQRLSALDENRWSVFYSLSRPGLSANKARAMIQVTALCPAGPPNYSSIYFLEEQEGQWTVNAVFGVYNQ